MEADVSLQEEEGFPGPETAALSPRSIRTFSVARARILAA